MRWFDDLAVVVTFRQMDPLYTVDLSDPDHPRLRGELKIPGFSGYLHPIGHDRLLGVGIDATSQGHARGAQVSVFDVSDLAHPVQVDRYAYGGQSDLAAPDDPRAFTWVPGPDGAGVGWTQVQDYTEGDTFRLSRIAADASGHLSVTTSVRPGVEPWDGGRVLPLPARPGAAGGRAERDHLAGLRFRRASYARGMCRNIRPLHNFEPPATRDEMHAAAVQYVRKISGTTKPSQANQAAFDEAVLEVAAATRKLLASLTTSAPPKDRDVEAAKRRARSEARYA